MEYIVIGICIAVAIVMGAILYWKMKKQKDIPSDAGEKITYLP